MKKSPKLTTENPLTEKECYEIVSELGRVNAIAKKDVLSALAGLKKEIKELGKDKPIESCDIIWSIDNWFKIGEK